MRGEYTYYAQGNEFAHERFTLSKEVNGQVFLRSRVWGISIKLAMNLEMQFAPNGCPLHLSFLCEYAGAQGSADYSISGTGIKAVVRSGGIERHLEGQTGESCVILPHAICAYRQFALVPQRHEQETLVCWVDIFDVTAFLRPRMRRVTVLRAETEPQITPAGTFNDVRKITVVDASPTHPISGEGYLGPNGVPVIWREADDDYSYVLTSFNA